jgi:4a-hydroxytetrahydrobiopterin dehydratase
MPRLLDPGEIDRQLAALDGWTCTGDALVRTARAPGFLTGIEWVRLIAQDAEAMDHHPDIDIRWLTITFRLRTHSAGGVTQLDVELAHRIDEVVSDR